MSFILQHIWLVKIIAFFAVIGFVKVVELMIDRVILDKYNLMVLTILTLGVEMFKFLTR